jgi:hypothetical protein
MIHHASSCFLFTRIIESNAWKKQKRKEIPNPQAVRGLPQKKKLKQLHPSGN